MKKKIVAIVYALLLAILWCTGCSNSKADNAETEGKQTESQYTESENTESQDTETQNTEIEDTQLQDTENDDRTMDKSMQLQVIGTQLCDSNGNPILLRGLSTHGLAWYPDYVNEAAFKEFHEEWGVDVIRLAMYTDEYGYCTGNDKEWLKSLVKKGVEYAIKNNLYVIIDWHTLRDNNPNTYVIEAMDFFREMSKLYADYDNVIYEICNEPNGDTNWTDIKNYAENIIPVIRANDPDALILVGTPRWCQSVKDAAADPITGYDNIMYTLHFYAATHTEWLRNDMVSAINSGLPIFVSEYGICDASGSGNIDEYQANEWIRMLNQYGVSHVAWNISNKNETSAIIGYWCNKTSGWKEEDLSTSGKWMYNMLRQHKDK